jgi:hypothetical protein
MKNTAFWEVRLLNTDTGSKILPNLDHGFTFQKIFIFRYAAV